jgi:hypothetical protein
MTDDLIKRLLALDTCAVSDALDHLHVTGATDVMADAKFHAALSAGQS